MQPPPEIRNLKELLEPRLNGRKVSEFSTKYLTVLGDNYGSTMLAVSVQIQNDNKDKTETLELVAKMPSTNQQLREMFQTEITFIKENAMYTEIFPALLELQREMKVPENEIIDAIPLSYGARISLDKETDVVDDDAVLLLENLKVRGFVVGDRAKGFDNEHVLIILKNLATFNAIPIALKLLKPKTFDDIIRRYVIRIDIDEALDEDTSNKMNQGLLKDLENVKGIEHLCDRIKNQIDQCKTWQHKIEQDPADTSPFTTIVHNDFWVNNMMISYDEEGHPNAVKIVDFQLMMIESFAHDLIFFLFSSVEQDMLDEKMDEYIKYYYDSFYNCLKELGCPLNDFTYEKFLAEIQRKAPYELFHILIMLKVFLAKKESIPDTDNYDNDFFTKEDLVGPEYFVKLRNVVKEFEKRNWIM